jgi:hypothetical protein
MPPSSAPNDSAALVTEIEALGARLAEAKASINRRFIGQDRVVDLVLASMLCGGHALLVGLPGLGKTRLVDTLSTVMGLKGNRIQFTPDLMPADILGLRGAGDHRDRRPRLPLHRRPDLLPASDGGRDQPRQPAHPIGPAAGDAGA